MIGRVVAARWNIARLLLAGAMLWVVAADAGPRWARLRLAGLAEMDYAGEVSRLRAAQRFGEALVFADAGERALTEEAAAGAGEGSAAAAAALARLRTERAAVIAERDSTLRMAREFGLGALSGEGSSLERLAGAVTADLFVAGDVRDLLIQGTRLAIDGEADAVIAGLSALGLATTLTPTADAGASVLKLARKSGALSRGAADAVAAGLRGGADGRRAVMAMAEDAATLAGKASPGGALRVMRRAENAEELAALTRFASRHDDGAFALLAGGEAGTDAVKRAARAEGAGAVLAAERLVIKAARRGENGARFLASRAARVALRPHPLIGVAKALAKGHGEALVRAMVERLDPRAWWILPALAGWTALEAGLLMRRLTSSGCGARR